MRILLLTQYYPPEPVTKFADVARALREQGHDVQVITGFPCYPAGKTYLGYRQRPYHEETANGILVTRVPQFPDHSRSIIRRACYYLSFALMAATIGLWRARTADVILVYQSAAPTGVAAWFLSRLKRIPYVLDVADLWPESVAASGMMRSRILIQMISACMRFIYHGAARITVITEGYRQRLVELGVPAEKLSLVHYWHAAGQFDPLPYDAALARKEQLEARFNVMYCGAMGPVQELETVLEAAALLTGDSPRVQFVLVGDGVAFPQLVDQARQQNLANVRFLGRRSPQEVQQLAPMADVQLVHLQTDALSRISIPSKTFSCMASARPILMAVEGEASQLVEKHACGVTVPPSDPQAMADAIRRLTAMPADELEQMAANGRRAYLDYYCSAIQIPKFESLLREVVANEPARMPQSTQTLQPKRSVYGRVGKRIFDLMVSVPLAVIALPVILSVAVAVRLNLGSPVFFTQSRPGLGGKLFTIRKFRTMREAHDAAGNRLPDSARVTPLGRFLRGTSLDELPELWNVIRGDMSLVGPRPLLPDYLPLYTPEQARRHDVRPGITGLAQVNGRNAIGWDDRFTYDLEYVDRVTLRADIMILLRTIGCVLRRHGINASPNCTMPPFTGSAKATECARAA
jgi:lipopolysaccharide/colanic/teichoic acid biosynthesis glycosyltransferase/glycosyltransferase involved in cell wall biosynthesis